MIFLIIALSVKANIDLKEYNETFASEVAYKYVKVSYCGSDSVTDIANFNWTNEVALKYFSKNEHITTFENKVRTVFSFTTWDPVEQMVVLCYRGTTNIWNWVRNIKYDKLNTTEINFYEKFSHYSENLDDGGAEEVHLGFF